MKIPSYKQYSNSYFSYYLARQTVADKHIIVVLLLLENVEHSGMNECCTLAALCSVILLFTLAPCLFPVTLNLAATLH